MTAYEIIMVFLGILALLISFGGFIIALLTSVSYTHLTLPTN